CRRSGGRAAGGRHALLRHHRLPENVGDLRGAVDAALRALRAVTASPARLRAPAAAPSRILFRSRTDRIDALRRIRGSDRRRARARSLATWPRSRVENAGCGAVPDLSRNVAVTRGGAFDNPAP